MSENLKRSLPFITNLLKARPRDRKRFLQAMPNFVIDTLIEILYNTIQGNIRINSNTFSLLSRQKRKLLRLINTRRRSERRALFNKQSGGFLPFLLPIISSVAASLLSKAIA